MKMLDQEIADLSPDTYDKLEKQYYKKFERFPTPRQNINWTKQS